MLLLGVTKNIPLSSIANRELRTDELLVMTEQDLHELRREKWRLDGKPIRTIEEARAFVEGVGFCLMYPMRPTHAGADVYWGVRGFGQSAADVAARLLRSAGVGGDGDDGAVAARAVGLRGEFVRGEQCVSGGGFGVSIFLCAGGRTQSQAGAEAGAAVALFAAGLRCV